MITITASFLAVECGWKDSVSGCAAAMAFTSGTEALIQTRLPQLSYGEADKSIHSVDWAA